MTVKHECFEEYLHSRTIGLEYCAGQTPSSKAPLCSSIGSCSLVFTNRLHSSPHIPSPDIAQTHLKSHLLLDLRDSSTGVQSLRARPRAVQNSVASVQAHAVIQLRLSLLGLLISRVGNPAETLHQHSRAEVLLRVPPVRRARCGAAGA